MERAIKLQNEYIREHGLVGLVVSKSKVNKSRRYYLHGKLKSFGVGVKSRQREITTDWLKIPAEIIKYAAELMNVYGYTNQITIDDGTESDQGKESKEEDTIPKG